MNEKITDLLLPKYNHWKWIMEDYIAFEEEKIADSKEQRRLVEVPGQLHPSRMREQRSLYNNSNLASSLLSPWLAQGNVSQSVSYTGRKSFHNTSKE